MTSPYRDPERPGGQVPWRERLLPLLAVPGQTVPFPMSSRTVAKTTAHQLRRGIMAPPPGRWRFQANHATVRVTYLGPDQERPLAKPLPNG